MAEPNRKINKGRHTPNSSLTKENSSSSKLDETSNEPQQESPLIFWTLHPTDPLLVDLTQFATGRTFIEVKSGKRLWRGDYSGRPQLILELLPAIKYCYEFNRAASWGVIQENLRTWWRVFEEAESSTEENFSMRPVNSVADLQMIHHHIAKMRKVNSKCHTMFLRIANLTRAKKELPPLHWPMIERDPKTPEVPELWEIERIRHTLKHIWFNGLRRIEANSQIEPDLWSWKKTYFKNRDKHAQEIYRAVIKETGHPLPSPKLVSESIGVDHPSWMKPYAQSVEGIYLAPAEVRAAFFLCLIYTGWNPSTLCNLQIDARFVDNHPTNPDYHVVYAYKHRGNTEHHCIGRNKRTDSPGTILRTLVELSKPLRELVKTELLEIEDFIANGANTGHELNALLKRRKILQERVLSPWLFPDSHGFQVMHLHVDNINYGEYYGQRKGTFLARLIAEINQRQLVEKQIKTTIKPSDLRDVYIGFAYEFSNYSVLSAQIAATHKSSNTTQIYLNNTRWKAHSAQAIHKFGTVFFKEIDERQSVDPTILRATMEWNAVSEEERGRLELFRKNRTRVGIGCKDPSNPPSSVAPNHTGGGCRIQRCTLCPQNAILLPDSDDGIAMRVSELEYLRTNTPVTVWENSSFPEELSNALLALTFYAKGRVDERLSYWRKEINDGRHKPITWEGSY